MGRLRIDTDPEEMINGIKVVQHWRLYFDDFFIASTSVPQHVGKWRELEQVVNSLPEEQI